MSFYWSMTDMSETLTLITAVRSLRSYMTVLASFTKLADHDEARGERAKSKAGHFMKLA